jgi:hypothetical protein
VDLDAVADELYGLLPEQFTAARTAREKQARAAGEKDVAAQIRSLAKPNQVAWLANQLARGHGDELRPLLELGAGLRDASATLTGDQLRDFSKQKRQLVSALVQRARRLAAGSGRKVSDDTARGLEDTLNAGLADPDAAEQLIGGRLTIGLQHTGFGPGPGGSASGVSTTRGSSPAPGRPPARARRGSDRSVADRLAGRLAAADADLEEAMAANADAGELRDGARSELDHAERAVSGARDEVSRLRDELESAIAEETRAEREQRQLRSAFECAERGARLAHRRLQEAQQRRDRLVDPE